MDSSVNSVFIKKILKSMILQETFLTVISNNPYLAINSIYCIITPIIFAGFMYILDILEQKSLSYNHNNYTPKDIPLKINQTSEDKVDTKAIVGDQLQETSNNVTSILNNKVKHNYKYLQLGFLGFLVLGGASIILHVSNQNNNNLKLPEFVYKNKETNDKTILSSKLLSKKPNRINRIDVIYKAIPDKKIIKVDNNKNIFRF